MCSSDLERSFTLEPRWSESLARVLTSWWMRALLVIALLACFAGEMMAPGLGWFSIAGLGAAALLFAGPLLAGLAGHSMLPLSSASTAGYGLFLGMLGHLVGWPVARGGSQSIADALVSLLSSLGGIVECGWEVQSLDELPPSRAVLADVTPRQLLAIAGNRLPARYQRKLQRFRYGPGVHKVDWVLDGPVPWLSPACHAAGTVHVGGAFEQVAAAEEEVSRGRHPERPFVLLVQPSQCDGTRSPTGMHVVWEIGRAHV
mgnify:CR=1 FL=1